MKKIQINKIRCKICGEKRNETDYILASPQTVADIEKSRKDIKGGNGIEIDLDRL